MEWWKTFWEMNHVGCWFAIIELSSPGKLDLEKGLWGEKGKATEVCWKLLKTKIPDTPSRNFEVFESLPQSRVQASFFQVFLISWGFENRSSTFTCTRFPTSIASHRLQFSVRYWGVFWEGKSEERDWGIFKRWWKPISKNGNIFVFFFVNTHFWKIIKIVYLAPLSALIPVKHFFYRFKHNLSSKTLQAGNLLLLYE